MCIVCCLFEYWLNRLKVLSRRTKSDPVVRFSIYAMQRIYRSVPQLIGPSGVGKIAILEGLASKIVAKEVP